MPVCNKCHIKLLWKQPYDKTKPFSENVTGLDRKPHKCREELRENLEGWYKIWKSVERYKVPIWCYICNRSFKSKEVCIHIQSDGFKEGIDTCEFYSDSYSSVKRRETLKKYMQKQENPYDPRQKGL